MGVCSFQLVILLIVLMLVIRFGPECLRKGLGPPTKKAPCDDNTTCNPSPSSAQSCCSVNPIVFRQIREIEDSRSTSIFAWKSGKLCLPNLASIYLGASIASIRDTNNSGGAKPGLVLIPQPVMVGRNWHFSGVGIVVVRLFQKAFISGFTIIHPPLCSIPAGHGVCAPNCFSVWGMNDLDEKHPFNFGDYNYDLQGESSQTFPVQFCSADAFQFIEFRFTTNHGNPDYTSLYQLQIHGDMGPPAVSSSSGHETSSSDKHHG